jgi:hypothetical protein
MSEEIVAVATDNKPFPFLRLPYDIRRMVYMLLLTHISPIRFKHVFRQDRISHNYGKNYKPYIESFWFSRPSDVSDKMRKSSTLLRVCRKIHEEATPILYGSNRMAFHWLAKKRTIPLYVWAGTDNLAFLKHVMFVDRTYVDHADWKFLRDILRYGTNLDVIRFNIEWNYTDYPALAYAQQFRFLRRLKDVLKVDNRAWKIYSSHPQGLFTKVNRWVTCDGIEIMDTHYISTMTLISAGCNFHRSFGEELELSDLYNPYLDRTRRDTLEGVDEQELQIDNATEEIFQWFRENEEYKHLLEPKKKRRRWTRHT